MSKWELASNYLQNNKLSIEIKIEDSGNDSLCWQQLYLCGILFYSKELGAKIRQTTIQQ